MKQKRNKKNGKKKTRNIPHPNLSRERERESEAMPNPISKLGKLNRIDFESFIQANDDNIFIKKQFQNLPKKPPPRFD